MRAAFDPARDGFGFRNPVGEVPRRTGFGKLLRPFDAFLYGNGLCFGMAVAALASYEEGAGGTPVSDLRPTPGVLASLRRRHARQLRPRVVLAAVRDWLASGGGRTYGLPGRLGLPGGADPCVLNFGPAANRRFLRCLYRAHAVVPYRVERAGEEVRVYVYDPNHPGDRGRYVSFRGGGFSYAGFRSREGWGITPLPLSAVIR
ncbi:hypothetical protein GBA65_18635 [Rubrobacter marinus]|uniref:Uncharacterized protein n=1 Tax=Rubrobacter marinus TaxID=2653852 RepID=A0A6G8Q161_9ACTN|nr:hypothetical protein [Rubrobacter marinus]QIN80201.1 hypothetical protein GBA65_18635 [Rubrobacter marinus]